MPQQKYVRKTPCDFCQHRTRSGCTVNENPAYCRPARDELFRWIEEHKKKGAH